MVDGLPYMVDYTYDDANRLTSVDSVSYTWDANGNLLNDGVNTYTYDSANRLITVSGQSSPGGTLSVTSYQYNGLGDRLTQDDVHYTLDLNAGLTQVLDDGTNTYLYGNGRISQSGSVTEYFMGDALGSVRQLTNEDAEITLTKAYEPYGEETWSYGAGQTSYGFASEFTDANGLIHLRARYYAPEQGRFFQRDPWSGNSYSPATFNPYEYGLNNPTRYTDPNGECVFAAVDTLLCAALAGGTIGGIVGAAVAAAYSNWMYSLAEQGKCSCEDQQNILIYTRAQFVGRATLAGAALGVIFGSIGALGAGPALIASLAGMGLSSVGIVSSVNRLQANPNNECAWLDLGVSLFGFAASAYGALVNFNKGVSIGEWINKYPTQGGTANGDPDGPSTTDTPDNVTPGANCSFTGDTEVTTSEGKTAISEIQIGDYILAWNQETGEINWYPVTARLEHEDHIIINLIVGGEEITTTSEHPFYTEEYGWLPAGQLQKGMHIRKADGSSGIVESTKAEKTTRKMYNLTVADAHTFYVGDGQWLVHNTCNWLGSGPTPKWGKELANYTDGVYEKIPFYPRLNSTIAIAENNGKYFVTSFGDQRAAQFLNNNAVKYGLNYVPNNSPYHAEVFLYKFFNGNVEGIGVSHVNGPCPECLGFFSSEGFANVFWTGKWK